MKRFGKQHPFTNKLWILLVALSFIFAKQLSAQDKDLFKKNLTSNNYQIEARFYYGFINNYHNELKIFNTHLPAFEIGIQKLTNGTTRWETAYNYPKVGLHFFYTSFHQSTSLGSAYALYPSIDFPLFASSKQQLNFRIGLGLAYFDTKFNPTDNYQNLAIGSDVNAFVNFFLNYEITLSKKDDLVFGLSLIHFSNGSITTPNYGLNLPLASVAYVHRFSEAEPLLDRERSPLFTNQKSGDFRLDIQSGFALKSQAIFRKDHFMVFTQSLALFKKLNAKTHVGLGFDVSWDESHHLLLAEANSPVISDFGLLKYGGALQYEIRLDKLALKIGLGTYLYGKEKTEGPIYEKLSLNYRFYNNIYASMELKAHAARAAYLAWGIGYQFHFKNRKL